MVLAEMAEKLRAVPGVLRDVVPVLAEETDRYLRECYARGVDPDGTPWEPTASGGRPRITGSQLTVQSVGNKIIVRLTWHDALHSKGYARGGKQRRLVPAGDVPPALAERFKRIVHNALTQGLK